MWKVRLGNWRTSGHCRSIPQTLMGFAVKVLENVPNIICQGFYPLPCRDPLPRHIQYLFRSTSGLASTIYMFLFANRRQVSLAGNAWQDYLYLLSKQPYEYKREYFLPLLLHVCMLATLGDILLL